jgi:(2Fe-2S) ferredoxin
MSILKKQTAEFSLVGQLLGFVIKDGYQLKYLRINFAEKEFWVKPIKEIRQQIVESITPGCYLEVKGIKKLSFKTGKIKLKAISVDRIEIGNTSLCPISIAAKPQPNKNCASKASILVCQKSSCWKRGGKTVCQMLEENLRDRDLTDKVQIKLTGCLKQCKHGPNVVVMPDKARYCKVEPERVVELLDKHFIM